MEKLELLKRWEELTKMWTEKEIMLELLSKDFINGNLNIDIVEFNTLFDKNNAEIIKLKASATRVLDEYTKICKRAAIKSIKERTTNTSVVEQEYSNRGFAVAC